MKEGGGGRERKEWKKTREERRKRRRSRETRETVTRYSFFFQAQGTRFRPTDVAEKICHDSRARALPSRSISRPFASGRSFDELVSSEGNERVRSNPFLVIYESLQHDAAGACRCSFALLPDRRHPRRFIVFFFFRNSSTGSRNATLFVFRATRTASESTIRVNVNTA